MIGNWHVFVKRLLLDLL